MNLFRNITISAIKIDWNNLFHYVREYVLPS
jgi:hypothetical protein